LQQEAIKAAQATGSGVCGTDFMWDELNAKWVCLEVNGNPSLVGVTEVTGQNVAAAIVKYTLEQCDRPKPARKFYDLLASNYLEENSVKPKAVNFFDSPEMMAKYPKITKVLMNALTKKSLSHD